MKITRLGHASFVFETKKGNRYLIDPFLSANPACPEKYLEEDYLKTIDAVFLTHGHFDHTSGLEDLKKINPDVMVVAQYELALFLMNKGYQAYPLNFGGSVQLEDVKAAMVQAKHTSSFGETEGPAQYVGEACGYVFDFEGDCTVYHTGDTAMMMDMKLIQDFYKPDIAIISCSGQFVMGPEEADYVLRNLLDVKYAIPSHTFPKVDEAARKEIMEGLMQAFPVIGNMIGKDEKLAKLLEDYKKTKVISMGYGETKEF